MACDLLYWAVVHGWRAWALVGVAWGGLGCGPSPQPLPPPIGIELSGLRVSEPTPGVVRLTGLADAVVAADTIEVINLPFDGDPILERQEVQVADDGSFTVDFEGAIDDVFRLQAFAVTGAQTDPIDLRGVAMGALLPAPTVDCVDDSLGPEISLQIEGAGIPAVRDLIFTNQCGVEVELSEAAILSSDGWLFDGLGQIPSGLVDGENVTFNILFDPDVPRDESNVAVMTIFDGTTTERRLFTVRGLAP